MNHGLSALALCGWLAACGGPPEAARTTVYVTSEAVAATYRVFVDLAQTATEDREAAIVAVRDVLAVTASSLEAAEAALDLWEHGAADEVQWIEAARCLAAMLRNLLAAIEAAGGTPPDALRTAIALSSTILGPCRPVAGLPDAGTGSRDSVSLDTLAGPSPDAGP